MLLRITLLSSLVIPVILLVLYLARIKPAIFWWLTLLGKLAVWGLVLALYFSLPISSVLSTWAPATNIPAEIALLVDPLSWSLAFALASLNLASFLTDSLRPTETDHASWISSLILTSLGIFTIFSHNPLTLVLGWYAIDFFELIALTRQEHTSPESKTLVLMFTARISGSLLVVAEMLLVASSGKAPDLVTLSPAASLLLILGACLRLGALPFYFPLDKQFHPRHGLGLMLRMVAATSSLVLVARCAASGVPQAWISPIVILSSLAGLYAGIMWFRAEVEIAGRRYWFIGMSCLVVAAAVLGQEKASATWILALMLPGGMLFLASIRSRLRPLLAAFGLLFLSALPFTPAWNGLLLYAAPFRWVILLVLLNQAVLLAGYARHILNPLPSEIQIERWSWSLYLLGLSLLAGVHMAIAILNDGLFHGPSLLQNWPLPALALLFLAFLAQRRMRLRVPAWIFPVFRSIFSFHWIENLISFLYLVLQRAVLALTQIFEGEGSLLWSTLALLLILTVLAEAGVLQK